MKEENGEAEVKDNLLANQEAEKVTEKTADEGTEEDNEGVPTDTGYAWIIVLNVFLIMTVIVGFSRSLSVLFVDISEEFQEKATIVSLMFTMHALSGSISSIVVSNVIMTRATVKNICAVAAIANSLISIAMSRAPNIVIFLLLFVMKGIFFGALLVGPMSLIGFYFKKRRSLALSLATAGLCAAFIVFPPITEALRTEYGLRGTFLVLAAIELHLVACALLLRSVQSYKVLYKSSQRKKQVAVAELHQLSLLADTVAGNQTTATSGPGPPPQMGEHTNDEVTEHDRLENDKTAADAFSVESNEHFRTRPRSDDWCSKAICEDHPPAVLRQTPRGSPALCSLLEDEELCESHSREDVGRIRRVSKKSGTFERQASHLSAISMTELPYIVADDKMAGETEADRQPRTFVYRLLQVFIDFSLFKIWRFRMMIVFMPLSVFANYSVIYMPVICKTLGISKADGALMMTVSGVMDLVTRVVTGFIGDFKCVSKPKLVAFSTLVVGTVCHCTRFFSTHALFMVYAVMVGVFGGVRQNFFNVMLMEYVGVDNMAKAYGLSSTLATLTLSINHPVVAALYDATNGFVVPLHYVGAMVYLGTLVLLLEPIFRKLDEQNIVEVKK